MHNVSGHEVSQNSPSTKIALSGHFPSRVEALLPPLVLLAGLVARLLPAKRYFLNPDEALHYLAASQPSWTLAYKAALTNAHPPLLVLVLHFWRSIGQSELILRLPSVLAGTACCWLAYLWLTEITDRSVAFIGLLLLSLAPSLIALSSEIRQYALLLFFMAACLLLSERAIQKNSLPLMLMFSFSLYGALLTHYSSLLFAFSIGIYLLLRLLRHENGRRLLAMWAAGQIGAIALIIYFLLTHVRRLREMGMPQEIAETWLRKSIFHAGERNVAAFAAAQTLRVFTYLFSHGAIGTLALLAFLAGIIALLKGKNVLRKAGPLPKELALLLGLPFIANCAAAFAGIYPYGGTRHSAFLAPFAIAGIAIGVATLIPRHAWVRSFGIVALLAVCNFFPAPPPLIKARNHSEVLMRSAINYLRQSAPPGSIVFSDYQSGLLLGYYACGHDVVQVFPPLQRFAKFDCGPYSAITARPEEWRFNAGVLPQESISVAKTYGLAPGTKVWLFDAGWINDLAPALSRGGGCAAPRFFGENILICELTLDQNPYATEP